ncbi:MAG TPA: hypothetical protein PLQ88_05085 [Blastocatellia bacterium]|nr:hypothetical protein [Blastocatellia bacterium]
MDSFADQLFADTAPAVDSSSAPAAPAPAPVSSPAPFTPPAPATEPPLDSWELPPAEEQQQQQQSEPLITEAPAAEAPVAPVEVSPALPGQLGTYIETYGAENVEALTNMAFGLMGIGEIPEGKSPQAHFLDQIYAFDQRAYSQLVGEIVRSHEADFVGRFRERVLQEAGLPTSAEELQQLRDYARYGSQYVADEEARTFLNQVPQNLQATFQRQSQAYRDYLVSQVAGGYMRPEVAIEALQEREANHQRDLRDQEATRQYEQQQQQQIETRAHQSANQALYEQRERIIEQKAKADNLHPEIVRDIYARAGQELEEYANAALYGYAKTQQEYEIGVAAIRGYQALVEAQKTGSQLAVKQAMNSLRILAEQRYSHHLQTRRSRATAQAKPANPAPGAPQLPAQMAPAQPRSGYQLPNGQNLTEALFS